MNKKNIKNFIQNIFFILSIFFTIAVKEKNKDNNIESSLSKNNQEILCIETFHENHKNYLYDTGKNTKKKIGKIFFQKENEHKKKNKRKPKSFEENIEEIKKKESKSNHVFSETVGSVNGRKIPTSVWRFLKMTIDKKREKYDEIKSDTDFLITVLELTESQKNESIKKEPNNNGERTFALENKEIEKIILEKFRKNIPESLELIRGVETILNQYFNFESFFEKYEEEIKKEQIPIWEIELTLFKVGNKRVPYYDSKKMSEEEFLKFLKKIEKLYPLFYRKKNLSIDWENYNEAGIEEDVFNQCLSEAYPDKVVCLRSTKYLIFLRFIKKKYCIMNEKKVKGKLFVISGTSDLPVRLIAHRSYLNDYREDLKNLSLDGFKLTAASDLDENSAKFLPTIDSNRLVCLSGMPEDNKLKFAVKTGTFRKKTTYSDWKKRQNFNHINKYENIIEYNKMKKIKKIPSKSFLEWCKNEKNLLK